jgi:hypothetical protein
MTNENNSKREPSLAELYPNLTPEELVKAEENLDRYLQIVLRIYKRIKADPEEYARFRALTDSDSCPTMNIKD